MASDWLQSMRPVARWCHMPQTQRRAVTHTPTDCQSCQDITWPQDVCTQTFQEPRISWRNFPSPTLSSYLGRAEGPLPASLWYNVAWDGIPLSVVQKKRWSISTDVPHGRQWSSEPLLQGQSQLVQFCPSQLQLYPPPHWRICSLFWSSPHWFATCRGPTLITGLDCGLVAPLLALIHNIWWGTG
jgi:hypothetical protein